MSSHRTLLQTMCSWITSSPPPHEDVGTPPSTLHHYTPLTNLHALHITADMIQMKFRVLMDLGDAPLDSPLYGNLTQDLLQDLSDILDIHEGRYVQQWQGLLSRR